MDIPLPLGPLPQCFISDQGGDKSADMTEANPEEHARPRARVSDLGEFIRFDSCERRFRLSHNNRAAARRLPFFERLFSSLDPVLQQAGNDAEDDWQAEL